MGTGASVVAGGGTGAVVVANVGTTWGALVSAGQVAGVTVVVSLPTVGSAGSVSLPPRGRLMGKGAWV
jgi:hypothetical protein